MKGLGAALWAVCILSAMGCRRPAAAPAELGDALRTTDGVLAASNIDTLIRARELAIGRDPRWAAERAVLVDLLQTRGQLFGHLEDYDRAEAVADAAVQKAPHLPESWLARASSRLTLHRFQDALADLEQAQQRGADVDAVEALRASALLALGRTDDALPLRRHAVQRWASTSNLTALAVAEIAAGDFAQANAHLDSAVRAFHDVAPFPLVFIDFQRGLMAEEVGDLDRASARYRSVLRRLPSHVQAAVHLAAIALARGQAEAAAAVLAPLGTSDDPEVLSLRADVLEHGQKKDEAERLRRQVEARYRALVEQHPEAFADHAARFLLTRDIPRALALARLNLAVRATPAAYELALSAAGAAGDKAQRCQLAKDARTTPHPTPRLEALTRLGLEACATPPLPAMAGPLVR
jgi:tetratricopeptide (TPR) repeat protein